MTVVAGIRIRLHEDGVRRVIRQRAGEHRRRRDRADVERRVDRVEHVEHFAEQLQARRAADRDALGHAQVELRERSAAAAVDRLARAHLLERRIAGIVHVLEPVRGRVDVVADAVEVVVVAVPDVHRQRRPVAEDRRHGDAPRRLDDGAQRDLVPRIGAGGRAELHVAQRVESNPARGWSSARRPPGRRGPWPPPACTTHSSECRWTCAGGCRS